MLSRAPLSHSSSAHLRVRSCFPFVLMDCTDSSVYVHAVMLVCTPHLDMSTGNKQLPSLPRFPADLLLLCTLHWGVSLPSSRSAAVLHTINTPARLLLIAGQAHACRQGADASNNCTYGSLYTVHKALAYAGIGIYICYHIAYVRLGHRHATIAPYFSFRYLNLPGPGPSLPQCT